MSETINSSCELAEASVDLENTSTQLTLYDEDYLNSKIREEARARVLQKKSEELLDNSELQELWILLEKSVQSTKEEPLQLIDYVDFKHVASLLSNTKAKKFFTAKIFAQLQENHPNGKISIVNFFNYVMRKMWLQQTKIALSLYDSQEQGFLRESDLDKYVEELIPTLTQLKSMDQTFHQFYICVAVRKFFFYLDPSRKGKIRIVDILCSGFLDDFLELRDTEVTRTKEDANWFSYANALRLYHQYIELDEDQNGMLSKSELMKYGNLTSIFIDRLYEECITYQKEIDFKMFVDIVLALENRKEPRSLGLFFKILDIHSHGYIDGFVLNYFFKGIIEKMREQELELLRFEDICDEIFDMVTPEQQGIITLHDLIACGQGDTVVSMLIDVNGFLAYENREILIGDVPEEV